MKRKVFVILFALTLILVMAIGMGACEKLTGESIEGTYYSYENGSIVKSDYITLKDGKWVDSDGLEGTYKVSDEKITLYSDFFGEEIVKYEGTIKDGVIKLDVMGEDMYFCKEGKTPPNTNPDDGQQNKPNVTKYSVTYNANGGKFSDGSSTYEQSVDENALLTAPVQPIKQGCSFAGWSKIKSSSDMWQFAEDRITENITLYAIWKEKTASILSIDGATIEDNSIFMLVNKDTDYVSLATKVVCSSDSTWRLYYDRLGLTEIPTKIATQKTGVLKNGNNVFYIVVTSFDGTQVNTYELTLHRSYLVSINYIGVYGMAIETRNTYTGYEYIVNYIPSISGYTFNYWKNEDGEKATDFIPYSSTNLYADCNVNTYTATLDVNGGDEISKIKYDIKYDSDYSFPRLQRTGYTFLGWYDNTTQLTDGNGQNLTVWKYASNKNITARWQANKYTVTLNSNDSNAGTVSGSGEHSYDSNVTITAKGNLGYVFDGWYNGEEKITDKEIYTFALPAENVIYTAKWSIDEKLLPFNFSSTVTTLTITGLKDETLTSVDIPSGVTSIGDYAFSSCSSLTSIEIPRSVTTIGSSAFGYCISLTIYCEASSAPSGWASECIGYRPVVWNCQEHGTTDSGIKWGLTKDGIMTIAGYSGMSTEIVIPSTINGYEVSSIGSCAFHANSGLTSVTILGSVTSIGSGAFWSCSSLTSVTIPSSVTSIGEMAFEGCSSLTSIEIPSSVTRMGDRAFKDCSRLTIYCEAKSSPSGWGAFNYSSRPVWWGYKNITTDVTYNYVVHDDKVYLTKYKGIETDVVIPNTIDGKEVVSIGSTFDRNNFITSIEIPSGVTSLGAYAFSGCSELTSIEIPSSVMNIGNYAFSGCSNLIIYCEAASQPSGWDSNWNSINRPVVWNCKSNDIASDGNIYYVADDGLRYALKDELATVAMQYISLSGAIVIPSQVIYKGSVYNVTSIGDYAFSGCSELTSITIPSGVTSIGNYSFLGCSSLTSVTFENTSGWYYTINSSATSGTSIDVTDPETNVTNLKSMYSYYWQRNA